MIFIGDVHGKYQRYETILKHSTPTVQVGDMGVGFFTANGPVQNPPYDKMLQGGHRFIRGNHDNPSVCRGHTQWIEDGHTETTQKGTKIFFLGGAWSIDKNWRTPMYDWWPDEELDYPELNKLIDQYVEYKPDVVVTHDGPGAITAQMFLEGKPRFPTATGEALQQMFDAHKPKLWLMGHWHISKDVTIEGCRFICLAELEVIDVDI